MAAGPEDEGEDEGAEGGGEGLLPEGGSGGGDGRMAPAGGYAARRAKRARAEMEGAERKRRGGGGASGDALDDDWASGSDGSGEDSCLWL